MAKNFSYKRSTTDKISVKGKLNEDGTAIRYLDENKVEQEITIAKCLNDFKGQDIDFTVSIKDDSELTIEEVEE